MFRNFGLGEILLLVLLALIIFGPEGISKIGRELGKSINAFQEGLRGENKDEKDKDQPTDES